MRYRINYRKIASAIYISHLDIQRAFQRAFHRADLPLEYTMGFNPHEKMSYSPPLPLFVSSDDEYIDLDLAGDESAKEIYDRLRPQMPKGLVLNGVTKLLPTEKPLSKTFKWADYEFTLKVDDPTGAALETKEYYEDDDRPLTTTKRTKTNKNAVVDIRPLTCEFDARESEGSLIIRSFLNMSNESLLNPLTFLKALQENIPSLKDAKTEKIHKIKAYR
ncbi:MAG: TIGR03936 family radical SAM-associated protein [Eubacteriales bacterium]|nr:TIGR03936 family radical SAM-associated protein [Eubacteriales bacterium]